ncbi:debra isoform 2-T2 [Cochliomyia hominivorax]
MDIHSNLEYLCRVCAANTKGKNSVAECVYILKTAGLKDKLDKFLYLKISENDSLPKVLCKTCFRQVEATAALSKIAKHTQQVFRDFLLSTLPKGPSDSTNTSEFTSSDFSSKKDTNDKTKKDEIAGTSATTTTTTTTTQMAPPSAPATVTSMLPPPLIQPLTTTSSSSRKDEVIVNVSVSDPLTRDNQQKMISNSQRRQSLLLDSRYTPKSIAQKSSLLINAEVQKSVTPKVTQTLETVNTTNTLKTTTPTLNFYPINKTQQQTKQTQQQQTQQTQQITTFSSGGYVIGRINTDKEEPKKITLPLAATADNVLQQKRKNLVKALNNIKANNSGQVSLLKSSQQKQTAISKIPLTEVVNQAADDELPDKIIIAAPKNKSLLDKTKKEPLNLSSKIPAVVTAVPNTTATITAVAQQQQPDQTNNYNNTPPKPAFPEDILLGRVIRDMDLLKLILKALKWPVNKQNMELQLQRLKNSKFTDIMSDTNLLQDTDLTQLLGPYLAPVLLAAQALQQQQQQLIKNSTINQNLTQPAAFIQPAAPKMSALEAAQAEINKSIPYKLPPETSVQLVPATPEEQEEIETPPAPTLANITTTTTTSLLKRQNIGAKPVEVPQKRQKRAAAQRARDSIVISDEEDLGDGSPKKSRQRSSKNAGNIEIELNSNFMSQFSMLAAAGNEEANEALLALLQRQKAALMKDKKVQRRRRNSVSNLITLPASEFDALIDLDDDIVLMEPVTTTSSVDSVSASPSKQDLEQQQQQQQQMEAVNNFVIPTVPLITRPIIKRRKTVIHSSRGRLDTSVELKSPTAITVSKDKLLEETINQVAKGNLGSDSTTNEVIEKPTPPKITSNNENSLLITQEVSATKSAQQKKTQSKASLGQQLLEAIGLQKITTSNSQTEAATSSSNVTNTITVMPNSKQSIQQIRTALKKSLKQAQEQQQQRKKELSSSASNNTIIQDADSTTKPAVKEIVVVEGKGNNSDNNSSMVDVEEQIDKVTLMVRKNDKDSIEEQPSTSEKEDKKEMKKSSTTKINERRRTMPTLGAKAGRNANVQETKEKNNKKEDKEEEEARNENNEAEQDKEKPDKEEPDNANISSSSGANSNEAEVNTKEEVATPKRRGRKRLVDKQNDVTDDKDLNEDDKDKEKDNKSTPAALTERSRTFDKSKEEENDKNNKNEEEQETTTSNKTPGRPTRQSKTQSKYYKGPEKPVQGRRSLPSRTTRNR